MDRLAEIEERLSESATMVLDSDMAWLIGEIKNKSDACRSYRVAIARETRERDEFIDEIESLRADAHADQVVILNLRQDRLAAINEADAFKRERDEFRAKLAHANQQQEK